MTDLDLVLTRTKTTAVCTLGAIAGVDFPCFTLEPPPTAAYPDIPEGRYQVILSYSTRFKKILPQIVNVPGRVGIRVHPGNTAADTEGCILLGMEQTASAVMHSRDACAQFHAVIQPVLDAKYAVWLTVRSQA